MPLESVLAICQHEDQSCANESQGSHYESEKKEFISKNNRLTKCLGSLCYCKLKDNPMSYASEDFVFPILFEEEKLTGFSVLF